MTVTTVLSDGLLSSSQVCEATGLNYRRLHYLVMQGLLDPERPRGFPGSGSPFRFRPDVVPRLLTAQKLLDVLPGGLMGDAWPALVEATMHGPIPHGRWVVYQSGRVSYATDERSLAAQIGGKSAVIARL